MKKELELSISLNRQEYKDLIRCKFCGSIDTLVPKYILCNGIVVLSCSSCEAHFIDCLDDISFHPSHQSLNAHLLNETRFRYINEQLHSNYYRFESKSQLVAKYIDTRGMKILDVGAGGGLFLNLMRSRGANVFGIEPSSTRIKFARQRYGLELSAYTVEHPYWQEGYRDYFDVVTIWDVIEHVNSPVDLLQNAGNLLRQDGFLFIDTPARDAFYYRVGQLTYFLTAGRWPSFLNLMYSNERYGHKQILSSHQLIRIVTDRCFQVIGLRKFHELSLPYSSYLGKIFKSQTMARAVEPLVAFFFFLARIKNKMLLVARKKM